MSRTCVLCVLTVLVCGCSASTEPTYRVGPDRPTRSLAAIVNDLKPGDVVQIDPGVYREVMKIRANGTTTQPIVIRGVPGRPRPVFDADGLNTSGKGPNPRGAFQIEGANIVLQRLEIRNARNGASADGVRLNGSTNATIRDCYIHHNDVGVFGDDRETATIEDCEIAFNSTEKWNGYAHNFYMHGNRVVVRNCYIHDCPFGQNFKTRAHYNELWYNWIADSNEGEVGPVDERTRAKHNTGLANSNTLLVGNVIVSRPRTGNPSKFILFGTELKDGSAGHDGTLYLFNNTLIAESDKIIFIQLADPKARLVASNNIFAGSDRIFGTIGAKAASVAGANNLIPPTATAPDGWAGTIKGDAKFLDAAKRDFRLRPDSPAVDAAGQYPTCVDGDGSLFNIALTRSPWPNMKAVPRTIVGKPDLGAYELGANRPATQPE